MSLLTIAIQLKNNANAVGAPPEFDAYIDKFGLAGGAFNGISGTNLLTITSGEYTSVKNALENFNVPAEAIAQLEKIKDILS
jgi:hypothetical protein